MSIAIETQRSTRQGEHRFPLRGIGWSGYEALLAMIGDSPTRLTYCDGDAELMSPLPPHELYRKAISFLVETIAEELEIPFLDLGSTTFKREDLDRGLEPDACYYFESARLLPFPLKIIDLRFHPAPDLAIEVEMTSSAIRRLPIYEALGVAEVWRYDGEALTVHSRQPDGKYAITSESPHLPVVSIPELELWIDRLLPLPDVGPSRRRFRAWVRDVLIPRHEADRPPGA